MNKKNRLNDILSIISNFEISTQEELTEELNKKGYNVSQATVSRDIKDLGIIKVEGLKKKTKFIKIEQNSDISPKYIELFKNCTTSISFANNLVVVKTLSGNAGTVGMAIDKMNLPQILGTVAGDDAVLIVTKTNSDAELLVKFFKSL